MIDLGDRQRVLAVRSGDCITTFLRFFDDGTSGWRYRAVARLAKDGTPVQDYGPFRAKNQKLVDAALEDLERLTSNWSGINLLDLASYPGPTVEDAPSDLLNLHADFFRFFQVNHLIVRNFMAELSDNPMDFRKIVPPLNLMLALDLRGIARSFLDHSGDALVALAGAPDFRDDPFTHGAGAMRAMADLWFRLDQPARELECLTLSQKLQPNATKGRRVIRLLLAANDHAGAKAAYERFVVQWGPDKSLAREVLAS